MTKNFTIFDLLFLVTPPVLALAGGAVGSRFGGLGLVIGAVTGFLVGCPLGQLPTWLSVRAFHRRFGQKTSSELRAILRSQGLDVDAPPNFILLELNRRGEDVLGELPVVLDMLEDDDPQMRRVGVGAITSAFPEMADQLRDYSPDAHTEECRQKVKVLRDMATTGRASRGERTELEQH